MTTLSLLHPCGQINGLYSRITTQLCQLKVVHYMHPSYRCPGGLWGASGLIWASGVTLGVHYIAFPPWRKLCGQNFRLSPIFSTPTWPICIMWSLCLSGGVMLWLFFISFKQPCTLYYSTSFVLFNVQTQLQVKSLPPWFNNNGLLFLCSLGHDWHGCLDL